VVLSKKCDCPLVDPGTSEVQIVLVVVYGVQVDDDSLSDLRTQRMLTNLQLNVMIINVLKQSK
jgi:hypothetical protein